MYAAQIIAIKTIPIIAASPRLNLFSRLTFLPIALHEDRIGLRFLAISSLQNIIRVAVEDKEETNGFAVDSMECPP